MAKTNAFNYIGSLDGGEDNIFYRLKKAGIIHPADYFDAATSKMVHHDYVFDYAKCKGDIGKAATANNNKMIHELQEEIKNNEDLTEQERNEQLARTCYMNFAVLPIKPCNNGFAWAKDNQDLLRMAVSAMYPNEVFKCRYATPVADYGVKDNEAIHSVATIGFIKNMNVSVDCNGKNWDITPEGKALQAHNQKIIDEACVYNKELSGRRKSSASPSHDDEDDIRKKTEERVKEHEEQKRATRTVFVPGVVVRNAANYTMLRRATGDLEPAPQNTVTSTDRSSAFSDIVATATDSHSKEINGHDGFGV